ncbi:hypothetical protein [Streptomyces sp. DH8]|uniref:hypothetical protein n=1 Tax=Streptomyces sp. DH8 TaxID=2857008 RepID=UPI001E3C0214|nr:hypothetical protein [Streptomyces sp. DH8]
MSTLTVEKVRTADGAEGAQRVEGAPEVLREGNPVHTLGAVPAVRPAGRTAPRTEQPLGLVGAEAM